MLGGSLEGYIIIGRVTREKNIGLWARQDLCE